MLAKRSKAGLNKQTKMCHVLSFDTKTCDFFPFTHTPLSFYTYWQHLAPVICWYALDEINQYHVSEAIIVTCCVWIQENLPPAPFSPKFKLIWQYKELLCHLCVWKYNVSFLPSLSKYDNENANTVQVCWQETQRVCQFSWLCTEGGRRTPWAGICFIYPKRAVLIQLSWKKLQHQCQLKQSPQLNQNDQT